MKKPAVLIIVLMICFLATGCAEAGDALPSGVYAAQAETGTQQLLLFIDWGNRGFLLSTGEEDISGRFSVQGSGLSCVAQENNSQFLFAVLEKGTLRYVCGDLELNPLISSGGHNQHNLIFRYSWRETIRGIAQDIMRKAKTLN